MNKMNKMTKFVCCFLLILKEVKTKLQNQKIQVLQVHIHQQVKKHRPNLVMQRPYHQMNILEEKEIAMCVN